MNCFSCFYCRSSEIFKFDDYEAIGRKSKWRPGSAFCMWQITFFYDVIYLGNHIAILLLSFLSIFRITLPLLSCVADAEELLRLESFAILAGIKFAFDLLWYLRNNSGAFHRRSWLEEWILRWMFQHTNRLVFLMKPGELCRNDYSDSEYHTDLNFWQPWAFLRAWKIRWSCLVLAPFNRNDWPNCER